MAVSRSGRSSSSGYPSTSCYSIDTGHLADDTDSTSGSESGEEEQVPGAVKSLLRELLVNLTFLVNEKLLLTNLQQESAEAGLLLRLCVNQRISSPRYISTWIRKISASRHAT